MSCLDFLFPPRLGAAEITVLDGSDTGRVVPVTFAVKTLKLEKRNDFDEVPVPGLDGQPLVFVRSRPRTMSMVLHFDGRDTNTDVVEPMSQVSRLMKVDRQTHAPPVVRFNWDRLELTCVLESLKQDFTSLFPDGRPSRGRMHVRFRERKSLQDLQDDLNRE